MKNIEGLIDEALKTEPSFQLRKDFKEKVVKAIQRKERLSQRKIYFLMALGTIIIIGLGFGVISYFTPSFLEQLKNTGNDKNPMVLLAVLLGVMISLIQYFDRRLVQKKLFSD